MLTTGESGAVRFGFIISKQVGTAVVRNSVRRRLKAVCAEALPRVPEGTDVVIRALPASATATYAELSADVNRCLGRLAQVKA
jgi:ribonuclease P protein component